MTNQNTNTKRTTIPDPARAVIEAYKHIPIGKGKSVRCPYYRNPRSGRERWGLNAYSGKGSPKEIAEEMKIMEKLEGKTLAELPEERVRDLMRKRKLGIECSGFITHILDVWLQQEKAMRIYKVLAFPDRSMFGKIAAFLRPFTHISIHTFTLPTNAVALRSWKELQAGDIIRLNTRVDQDTVIAEGEVDHAIFITGVEYDQHNLPKQIRYAHSVREKNGEGIKEGIIHITHPDNPIEEQEWKEFPDTGTTVNLRATTKPQFYHFSFLD